METKVKILYYLESGNIKKAEKLCRKLLLENPNDVETLSILGDIFFGNDDYPNALEIYTVLNKKVKNDIKFMGKLAICHGKLKKYTNAIKLYEDILKSDEVNIRVLMNLIDACVHNKDDSKINKYCNILRDIDPCNPLLASIDSLISFDRNKENKSVFIDNPINFIKEFSLKDFTNDMDSLIMNLITFSRLVTKEGNIEKKSTLNGWQTLPILFEQKNSSVDSLKKIIKECVKEYLKKYLHSNLLYIKRWPINYDLQGWTVFLSNQGMQKSHNHLSGWMSGVIYLQIPEGKNNNKEGSIEFSLHGYNYPTKRTDFPKKQIIPQKGSIVFFPSSLYHKTLPFTSTEERISIAFDLVLDKGNKRIGLDL